MTKTKNCKKESNKIKFQERVEMEKKMLTEMEENKRKRENEKFFLGEIIKKEKPEFGTNNLILAPTGSGKSYFIQEQLIPQHVKSGQRAYYLVSTTQLKESICPPENEKRKALAERGESLGFYTSSNKQTFGNVDYKIHVMTYAEFGGVVEVVHDEAEEAPLILCDEIHSAPHYRGINSDPGLTLAIHYLFGQHEGQTIYYFTATTEHLDNLNNKTKGQLRFVKTFDYREHDKIRKYTYGVKIDYNHLEQIRQPLRERIEGFNYYGHKALAFTAQIRQMEVMEKIFIEEGYRPLLLWSVNNEREMTPHQIEMGKILVSTGLIPSPYNVIIINGGLQEGWNLTDDKVRLAVINSTNETEITQSLGRYRGDMAALVQRTNKTIYPEIVFPERYMDKVLTSEMKEELVNELDLKDSKGRRRKWLSISEIAEEKGYKIINERRIVEGKRQRISIIKREVLK